MKQATKIIASVNHPDAAMLVGPVRSHYGSQVTVIPAANTSQQAGNCTGYPVAGSAVNEYKTSLACNYLKHTCASKRKPKSVGSSIKPCLMLKDIKPLGWVLGTSSGLKAYPIFSLWVSVQDSNDIKTGTCTVAITLTCQDCCSHSCTVCSQACT